MSSHESYAIGAIDLVDSTRYFPEGGDPLGKEAKRRHNEISSHILKKYYQETEPPKGDGFLFWGKDPIQTCLASIEVIKRIKTEVIATKEEKPFTMATKIVITKGLIEKNENKKDPTHGQAAHKCQRIMDAATQKHHTILIDSILFEEIKNHLEDNEIIYSGPYKLEVEDFGSAEVYQIADKEMGLKVDPTRSKIRELIKIKVKEKVAEEVEEQLQERIKENQKSKTQIIVIAIAIAVIFASVTSIAFLIQDPGELLLQNEIEHTIFSLDVGVRDAAFMVSETSQNDIMKTPLLTNYTENYPIMITEKEYLEKGIEKSRIDLITTVVDGMDGLYYLFVVPPRDWAESLQCRLYVIYPVGGLIPGENPDFLKQRDWCDHKNDYEMYLSSAYYSRGQKAIVTTMIIPIFDDRKQEVGYLAGAINFDKILQESLETSNVQNLGYILVDHDNCIVSSKYKIDSSLGNIVNIRELYTFNSGTIELASNEASCQNDNLTQEPTGNISFSSNGYSQFNGWSYTVKQLTSPEITKPEIDTNNFLEDWKLIVIQP